MSIKLFKVYRLNENGKKEELPVMYLQRKREKEARAAIKDYINMGRIPSGEYELEVSK